MRDETGSAFARGLTNYAAAEAIQKAIEAFPAETLIHKGNEAARGASPEFSR